MATPHINAKDGAFADTVLMPGDPLRAKYIAETFLENVEQVWLKERRGEVVFAICAINSHKGIPVDRVVGLEDVVDWLSPHQFGPPSGDFGAGLVVEIPEPSFRGIDIGDNIGSDLDALPIVFARSGDG